MDNSMLKVRHAVKAAGWLVIADNSDLEMDDLKDVPDIYSHVMQGKTGTSA
ncbi:non-canonical purine NTP pyrophosphatase [Candidatus Enterovibrio altilux]|uniref:non-canonical purine NTP pyrophosphatase n=1 Tax=Candidatus Enterovibrio altilux TaxID=1927128 RepID=UPI00210FB6C6|nr:non-canonical purine NTP pyrophosphatase [Candidatus Enterovibrio luxaltus]